MSLHKSYELPFFDYGLFKPNQLCFFRIKDFVESMSNAEVSGTLMERDGIPLLKSYADSKVKGVLIRFQQGCEQAAYNSIQAIEPGAVYCWRIVTLPGGTRANLLFGKNVRVGCTDIDTNNEWDGRDDPYFSHAIEEIETIFINNSEFQWDRKKVLRLQMAYSLLWTAMERYAGLRYNLGTRGGLKLLKMSDETTFRESLKLFVRSKRSVYSASKQKEFILDPDNPLKSLDYYYRVRCNAVHRGKAVEHDFNILRDSLGELLEIFKNMLNAVWNPAEYIHYVEREPEPLTEEDQFDDESWDR